MSSQENTNWQQHLHDLSTSNEVGMALSSNKLLMQLTAEDQNFIKQLVGNDDFIVKLIKTITGNDAALKKLIWNENFVKMLTSSKRFTRELCESNEFIGKLLENSEFINSLTTLLLTDNDQGCNLVEAIAIHPKFQEKLAADTSFATSICKNDEFISAVSRLISQTNNNAANGTLPNGSNNVAHAYVPTSTTTATPIGNAFTNGTTNSKMTYPSPATATTATPASAPGTATSTIASILRSHGVKRTLSGSPKAAPAKTTPKPKSTNSNLSSPARITRSNSGEAHVMKDRYIQIIKRWETHYLAEYEQDAFTRNQKIEFCTEILKAMKSKARDATPAERDIAFGLVELYLHKVYSLNTEEFKCVRGIQSYQGVGSFKKDFAPKMVFPNVMSG